VLKPAIRLATDGFPVPEGLSDRLERHRERLGGDAYTAGLFLPGGRPLQPGAILRQPDLARTLERIARHGEDGFYRGETAHALVTALARRGGKLTLADLAAYRPEERPPLRGLYRGREILTVPAPSGGGVSLVEMLQILDGFDLAASGPATASTFHLLASAMRLAFVDRNRFIGDPSFVDVPLARLSSRSYAAALRGKIPDARPIPHAELGPPPPLPSESDETTHLSVVDARGGVVSLTTTINAAFGSGVAAEGLGFLLNNEMDDFTAAPGRPNMYGLVEGEANAVAPRKRMASSMCPTLVLEDGVPRLVLGSPGGPRIPTALLQVILQVIDFGADLDAAVRAPRMHHQWLPDALQLEEEGFEPELTRALERMGYPIRTRGDVGSVLVAGIDPETGEISGAADPRRYGVVAGASTTGASR
jgi:gamma-glutamyltranspeptidase/glutathione hydrolase